MTEEETWTCPICGEENPIGEEICQGCGGYKEDASADAISDNDERET